MRASLALAAALAGGVLLAGCSDSTFVDPGILNCSTVHNYSIGNNASGQLDGTDCQLNDGAVVDYYRFTTGLTHDIRIVEQSFDIDPYVAVLDANGNLVTEETLAGSGTSEVDVTLPPGTYYIAVSSYQPGVYGSYTLTSNTFN